MGVRRKNVRTVGGEPLVARAVRQVTEQAAHWQVPIRLVVSTDDPQIAQVARLAGAEVVDRPAELAEGTVPVGEAVNHVCQTLGWSGHTVVWQPSTVVDDDAARMFIMAAAELEPDASGVMVTKDHKLRWHSDDVGVPMLNHARSQRQQSEFERSEVGIFACGRWPAMGAVPPHYHVADDAFTDNEVPLLFTYVHRAHDIDTLDDLHAARRFTTQTRVAFRVDASFEHGSGHLHRALTLADELQHLDPVIVGDLDPWATALCEQRGVEHRDRMAGGEYSDLVVVDTPHPDYGELAGLHADGRRVVLFEDDGPATRLADLVVNELLDQPLGGLCGPRYAVLRPEFLTARARRAADYQPAGDDRLHRVLVTFGGTDPTNAGQWVASVIGKTMQGVEIRLVEPPAVNDDDPHETPMAELMADADLVVTSAGRTVHEAMCVGVPVLSIPVNEREAARPSWPCVVRLPLLHTVSDDTLASAVESMLGDERLAFRVGHSGSLLVDGLGTMRVARAIETLALGLD